MSDMKTQSCALADLEAEFELKEIRIGKGNKFHKGT